MRLDPERGTLWKSGQEINLSPKEFSLLTLFLANDGLTLSRAELLQAGWGPECGEAQNLRTYIRKLRRKLEDDPRRPRHLLAEPWTGYRFHSSERPPAADHQAGESSVDYWSLRCRLPQYDEPALKALRLDTLRKAVHSNEVSFPHPVPTFKRHDRPDLQHKVVLLYFVSRWDCKEIARLYELTYQRVQQILRTWTRRAIECGYVQFIPPPAVLRSRPQSRPALELGEGLPGEMPQIPAHPAVQYS